ncbi:hypothetical protein RSAG8_11562, partial [Rhizoctonia solani AG-8 WAC10335]
MALLHLRALLQHMSAPNRVGWIPRPPTHTAPLRFLHMQHPSDLSARIQTTLIRPGCHILTQMSMCPCRYIKMPVLHESVARLIDRHQTIESAKGLGYRTGV